MFDFSNWSQLLIICILGAMSPGPSLAVILKNSISGGRKQGVFSGIGHGLGITFYALIAVFGLVTFFRNIPFLFSIVQIIGSIFLICMGSKMIISFLTNVNKYDEEHNLKISNRKGFIEGFMIAFLNPKIAAWVLALFSQFIHPEASNFEHIILILTVGSVDALWYCFVAIITTSCGFVNSLRSNAKRIDLVMGLVLVLVSLGMLWKLFFNFI